jgi:hypothetical protein
MLFIIMVCLIVVLADSQTSSEDEATHGPPLQYCMKPLPDQPFNEKRFMDWGTSQALHGPRALPPFVKSARFFFYILYIVYFIIFITIFTLYILL